MNVDRAEDSSAHSTKNHRTSSPDQELLDMLEKGNVSGQTGRYLVTFQEGNIEEATTFLKKKRGLHIADLRDFSDQGSQSTPMDVGENEALVYPEIGVALLGASPGTNEDANSPALMDINGSPIMSVDPEYYVFSDTGVSGSVYEQGAMLNFNGDRSASDQRTGYLTGSSPAYVQGFARAAEMLSAVFSNSGGNLNDDEAQIQALNVTWGLLACKVPSSLRTGLGIKVAVIDTGLDLGHPDFAARSITHQSFVGPPVHDLNGHGTHCTGTACGVRTPSGGRPGYGIANRSSIFAGKVFSNTGVGTSASILSGLNWAVANRCEVILAPFGLTMGPNPAYTAAGQAALNKGCLMIAGSASSGSSVGAPANSPTVMSVGAINQNLQPAPFSPAGKIDIAAPGVNIFSSYPRPTLYTNWGGSIASAASHVAGCAALWAESSPQLRGLTLWRKLISTARPLPYPRNRVGAGLVQAP